MDQAWLEDLSEDWPSEPKSSGSPAPSLPSFSSATSSTAPRPQSRQVTSSRIPKFNPQKKTWTAESAHHSSPLSERSLNEANVPLSQRASKAPSKLRDDISHSIRAKGNSHQRSLSDSTNGSAQYNTVELGSVNISPNKATHETPEWKRRLLHGDVAYGEKCDLFSSAGLENIFKPPPATKNQSKNFEESSVMPSSPPPYNVRRKSGSEAGSFSEGETNTKENNGRQPRQVQYRLASDGVSEFSSKDLSRSSSFQPRISADHYPQENGSDDLSMGPESSVIHQPGLPGRVISGQSDFRNEEFSPVYISKHPTATGKIDFVAGVPPAELNKRLEEFREESLDITIDDFNDSNASEKLELTADTDDFAHNGRFVNLRRGGRSQEGSFQKRMLSPSSLPAIDESAMLPEESMQASTPKNLPIIRKTRGSDPPEKQLSSKTLSPIPQTPHTSPSKSKDKQNGNNSGSPLKLFDTYDTFTNQKLLRRLSQFEEVSSNDNTLPSHEPTRTELNEAFVESPVKGGESIPTRQKSSGKLNSFGKGDLDDYQFSEDVSYDSQKADDHDDDHDTKPHPVLDRESQTKFKFQLEPSPSLENSNVASQKTKYTTNTTSTTSTVKQTTSIRNTRPGTANSDSSAEVPHHKILEDLQTPRKRNGDTEGKRLRISPLKDPTPKRRRTLQGNEVNNATSDSEQELDSFGDSHHQMQSVIGKKRKDARHHDDLQAANPKVLAMREILRPRSPTPSQKFHHKVGSKSLPESGRDFLEKARLLQDQKIAQIQAELDASDNSPKALGANHHLNRVGSLNTQDFLDEAKAIMAGIRGKARPRSGLTSLEESESENDRQRSMDEDGEGEELEDSYQESTVEPFSRPPSREGAPVQRLPQKQVDPELLDHLRKYQETSDFEGVIASSLRSISMAKEATDAVREAREVVEGKHKGSSRQPSLGEFIESDPPNIHLSVNPDVLRKRKHSGSSSNPSGATGDGQEAEFLSQGSTSSGSQSTSRSIPTGSSRGSDSRRVIAPETVSHLIPEQVAGMVLDRQRNIWIKRKGSGENGNQNFLPSDESEEDPFGGIPDLSVDETQELQRIKIVAAQLKHTTELLEEHHNQHKKKLVTAYSPPKNPIGEPAAKPKSTKGDLEGDSEDDDNHLPTLPREPNSTPHHQKQPESKQQSNTEEEIEREISIHEDRVQSRTTPSRRNVTITFSSPLTELIPPTPSRDVYSSSYQHDSEGSQDEGNSSVIITKSAIKQRSGSLSVRSSMRKPSGRRSLRGQSFSGRPVSRIDERDEDGYSAESQQRTVSLVVGTPAISRRTTSIATSIVSFTPRPTREIGRLSLSPLSDFTMHQEDESFGLNVSYVEGGQPFQHGTNTQRTLSLAIKHLVEKITEVEPYEPFWEHIKEMDLSNKNLSNLHKLDEFCGQVVELNASNNQINQLDGISSSVRNLHISHNCLTDLTAWGHLRNLQYIDVSNNEIESLSAFKHLVHLRGLRADNNMIKSVDGISQLDGLISLRLRGNLVERVDFRGTELLRLTHLDLRNNQISNVQNLHELRSLSDLDLEDNKLCDFYVEAPEGLETLRSLRLGGNDLESIDIGPYPNLRTLYLDRNRLGHLTGFLKAKHLDSLSLREQKEGTVIDLSFLSEAFEIRKLFMSGNLINSFEPQVDFLNLQYLELANCGLETLAPNLGQMICNTRVLNLNYNALKDISPLIGIVRLKKLHLAGNRLGSLRRITATLSEFPGASLIDLRANPLTQGYYPPVLDSSVVLRQGNEETILPEPYTMGKADSLRDAKYARCLDMSTKMLRRLFEIMMLRGCPRLKTLDGLNVNRALLDSRDNTWDALVARGLVVDFERAALKSGQNQTQQLETRGNGVTKSHEGGGIQQKSSQHRNEEVQELVQVEAPTPARSVFEERWGAEDSFA